MQSVTLIILRSFLTVPNKTGIGAGSDLVRPAMAGGRNRRQSVQAQRSVRRYRLNIDPNFDFLPILD